LSREQSDERFALLESYSPSTFIERLDLQLTPYFDAADIILKEYIREQAGNFWRTLPYRILNEKGIADTCAVDLLEMGEQDDFETKEYVFISRQLEDEAKHFMMLAKIYERRTSEKIIPKNVVPLRSQIAKYGPLMKKGEFIRRAANRFAGEGFAYIGAKTTAEMAGSEIGDAYKVITADEFFHKKLGQLLLERYASTVDKRSIIQDIVAERAKGTIKMYFEIYGYSKEAVEVYESNFGRLDEDK
jgi:hypothetical protein